MEPACFNTSPREKGGKTVALPRGLKATYRIEAPGRQVARPMGMDEVVSRGLEAYMWGWPLVNAAKRAKRAALLARRHPVVEGGMPVAFGRLAMLTDYMDPDERVIACPNCDTVYGAGVFDLNEGVSSFRFRSSKIASGPMRSMTRERVRPRPRQAARDPAGFLSHGRP